MKMKFCLMSFTLICFLSFCIIGCNNEIEDRSIGRITITGIPSHIPINGQPGEEPRRTFTIYFNASNFQTSREGLPEAKGLVRIDDSMSLQPDGTYTIVMDLELPNPGIAEPPNSNHGPWSGTARYFSVYITPQDTLPFMHNAIWAKGGYTFNDSKATIDWRDMVNMRNPVLNMREQNITLYAQIVHMDPEINSEWPYSEWPHTDSTNWPQ